MTKQSLLIRFLFVACAVLLLGNIGWFVRGSDSAASSMAALSRQYPLLSRRILTDNPNDMLINFVPLRKQLENSFGQLPAGTQKSFYFEYLPSGTSIRIGADQELIAASLIKVPLVMNLYHAAELGRTDLDSKATIQASDLDNAYGDLYKRGAGAQITLRETAKLALEQSDNTAAHVIFDATERLLSYDEESLAQLDVDQDTQNGQAVINAKSYTSVLKSLYLASYLSKDNSETLLAFLAHSTANNRLTKQLPATVTVAHKVGVYNASWSESDCGIVYVPKRPYAICVMVGLPEDQANDFIAAISKQVYNFVAQQ